MENIDVSPQPLSEEELLNKEYRQKRKELLICRMRASVLRNQITDAYGIMENIRFDFLSDTAFRDKITDAKRGLERAYDDFLLDDHYWNERIESHNKMTPKKYKEYLDKCNGLPVQSN